MNTVPSEEPPLANVPSTRRAILLALKRHGAMHSHEVAAELGVSPTAARQQLARLEDDGLVAHRRDPDGPGRPSHLFDLTRSAEVLFPKRYGDLTAELLGYLGGPDSKEVADLFDQRRQHRLDQARARLKGLALDGQVTELTRILDEDGYLADVEQLEGGGWRIVEHNCAILSVATGFRQACSSELAFIKEALPAATVERVAHRMEGGHICAYEVHPSRRAKGRRSSRTQ